MRITRVARGRYVMGSIVIERRDDGTWRVIDAESETVHGTKRDAVKSIADRLIDRSVAS